MTLALAFVGLLVGAGFATGQEVIQYFVSWGYWGLIGAVITGAIMSFAGAVLFQWGSYYLADEHNYVFRKVTHPLMSRVLDLVTTITLFGIGFVMLAGAGSNLNQQFGLDTWIGSVIMVGLVLATGFLDVDKVTRVIGAVTPVIIIAVFVALIITLMNMPENLGELNAVAEAKDSSMATWWISALNYTGLALSMGVSMMLVIGGNQSSPRAAWYGGLLGGIVFSVMLFILSVVLFLNIEKVGGLALPLLGVFDEMHPAVGFVVSLVIYAMIFNTAIGMFYALGRRIAGNDRKKFKIYFVAVVLVGFAVSFMGFKTAIDKVYPILGWIGLGLVGLLCVNWFRHRARIKEELKRRERLADLAERVVVDSEEDLTDKEKEEVRRLVDESHMNSQELWEAIREDAAEEAGEEYIPNKNDEDFIPNDPEGDSPHKETAVTNDEAADGNFKAADKNKPS